jgi:ABC-2 type transport system ATP-binding protein
LHSEPPLESIDSPTDHADALVALRDITKDFGRLRALDDVSLSIGSGVTGLLGPNGAGKTTLIKVILGLVRVRQGSGHVMGHRVGRAVRAIRRCIGYMPEDDCYLAGLTGVDMLQLAARLSGLPSVEALRRSHEILDFCGIEQERYRAVDTYSTGMRQKLKFAQAVVHDPPLLILDEPTSGLDPEERESMLDRVQILATKAQKAVLLSTHILPDVQSTCDHVVIMARGRVQLADRLDVMNQPSAPTMHVGVMGNHEPLVDRIRAAGYGAQINEDGILTLSGVDARAVQQLWDWAYEFRVSIRSLQPARNSLEDVFLAAVGEQQDAHP